MKIRTGILLALIAVLLVPGWSASGRQDDTAPNEFLRLLGYVPDTPSNRSWLTFGDVAAWHTSWGVPRIDNVEELDVLPRETRAYWMMIMSRQVAPPESMGINYLMQGDQRDFYGFDFFQVDRAIDAGAPLESVTLVEHHADSMEIAARLTENGYTATELDNGWTLYSILDDYEISLAAGLPRVGQLGQRNRIALRENQMIIARATDNVLRVVETEGDQPALAADPAYAAAAKALDDPLLADTGELIGVMTLDEPILDDAARFMLGERATPEKIEELRERLKERGWAALPVYDLAAFATRHAEGATYLIVVVVFPPGVDSEAAADGLAARIQNYISSRYEEGLQDRWAFDRAAGIDVDGLPVALVVMRADDPPPTPEDQQMVNSAVLAWVDLVFARDIGFLAVGDE